MFLGTKDFSAWQDSVGLSLGFPTAVTIGVASKSTKLISKQSSIANPAPKLVQQLPEQTSPQTGQTEGKCLVLTDQSQK